MSSGALAGERLLAALRGVGRDRPPNDPETECRIRARLEAAAVGAEELPEGVIVRVNKARLRQVLRCESHLIASLASESSTASAELIRGRLLDYLFAQVVVGQAVSADPVADALAAARISGDQELVDTWDRLAADDQCEIRRVVTACVNALAERWPLLPVGALPRVQEPLRAELAGGRVVLSGRLDLALGRPTPERAGSTLVDVKAGKRRFEDVLDAGWYAVLETLRHRAAPFQAGSYYLLDGALELAVFDTDRLAQATERIADGIARLVGLAQGRAAGVTPNPLCPWCPAIEACVPGQIHSAGIHGDVESRIDASDEDNQEDEF